MGEGAPISFGQKHDESDFDLNEVSAGIRTFTEEQSSESAAEIRAAVAKAELIVFLGFGYIEQNMEMLKPTVGNNLRECLGSAYCVSEDNRGEIERALHSMFHWENRRINFLALKDQRCRAFFDEHNRRIAG